MPIRTATLGISDIDNTIGYLVNGKNYEISKNVLEFGMMKIINSQNH